VWSWIRSIRKRPESLKKIYFRNPLGTLVPLEEVMNHQGGRWTAKSVESLWAVAGRELFVRAQAGRVAGTAIDHVKRGGAAGAAGDGTTDFPGVGQRISGVAGQSQSPVFIASEWSTSSSNAYESYVHPITILSGLPSAALGGLPTLWLFGNETDTTLCRLILLIGLVMKNRDHADRLRARRGAPTSDADRRDLRRLQSSRFRPS